MYWYVLVLVLSWMLSGCTALQPIGLDWDVADHCKDVRCVVKAVEVAEPQTGNRFKFMEGYRDSPLTWMYDNGYLTIEHINFTLPIVLGVFGYADIHPGGYGEVYKCHIKYSPSPAWRVLVHELSHCKGYDDRGFMKLTGYTGYTHGQKSAMMLEGKTKWTDTDFFKNGLYKNGNWANKTWISE